jgi:hypothetical protein
MKLSEAWERLARTHFNRRGSEFLCHRLGAFNDARHPSDIDVGEHRETMVARIRQDLGAPAYGVCDPAYCDDPDDAETPPALRREWKALACLMFAHEARDAERAQARKRTRA